jgi:hypothetical protein
MHSLTDDSWLWCHAQIRTMHAKGIPWKLLRKNISNHIMRLHSMSGNISSIDTIARKIVRRIYVLRPILVFFPGACSRILQQY